MRVQATAPQRYDEVRASRLLGVRGWIDAVIVAATRLRSRVHATIVTGLDFDQSIDAVVVIYLNFVTITPVIIGLGLTRIRERRRREGGN
jgi:hypothetical protein